MRVLVVTNMYLSGKGNGEAGAQCAIAEQVRSLRSAGLDVDVIFFDTKRTRLNYGLSFPRIVRAIASGRYDIVHTHHTYTLILVDLAKKLAGREIPVVLTNHEAEALDRGRKTRTWHPTSYLRHSLRVKRIAARRADFVIFVSRQLASAIGENGCQDVIPCGVDLGKFKPLNQAQCRHELGVPANRLVMFFPGDPRNARKRFELAQATHEVVRKAHPTSLMLTGGSIRYDLMPVFFNAADVVLQTSFAEAAPAVVREALACEVPVVSTDVGDTLEVVEGVPYCSVCPEDPRELASRVLEAYGHRALGARERLLSKDLELVQAARRIIRVYERVING